jgi:hypothetical protein
MVDENMFVQMAFHIKNEKLTFDRYPEISLEGGVGSGHTDMRTRIRTSDG